jgi:L-alanine-DL-glutamate epimerase-like enolase superfamily enzyme
MSRPTDIRIVHVALHLLPVQTRVPLKFGSEALTSVTCARVAVTVADSAGRTATGWGETPLSVQWVWPSTLGYEVRHQALIDFCKRLTYNLADFDAFGHPIEIIADFVAHRLQAQTSHLYDGNQGIGESMPHLAGLVCLSAFDIALHDAFGKLHDVDVYHTYNADWLSRDLSRFFDDAAFAGQSFDRYLVSNPPTSLPAWHLVGGLDPLTPEDLTGDEPDDGYPVLLGDWIDTDGLTSLKIKLRGNDAAWDDDRIVRVGRIAMQKSCQRLCVDFNCTVTDPQYVVDILDRLAADEPDIFAMILYVEQPFPYDLETHRIDVRPVSRRKMLLMDESAHDWTFVKLGRSLGWSGVALKTCKTQTGALLSLCWAKAHGMPLMVQDLTNPMLAMIPHARLAAAAGTIAGVETNACQFYPQASDAEAAVHPGLYQRRNGSIDLSTLRGPGFGYRLDEINRPLPEPVAEAGRQGNRK